MDPRLLDIASKYMTPEELKAFEKRFEMDRDSFIATRMREWGIAPVPQTLEASIHPYVRSEISSSFPLFQLNIVNKSCPESKAVVSGMIAGCVLKPLTITVPGNEKTTRTVYLSDFGLSENDIPLGKPTGCSFSVEDIHERNICQRCFDVVFIDENSNQAVRTILSEGSCKNVEGVYHLATLTLISEDSIPSNCEITVYRTDEVVYSTTMVVSPQETSEVEVTVPAFKIKETGTNDFDVKVAINGKETVNQKMHLILESKDAYQARKHTSSLKKIYADCNIQHILDLHNNKDGRIPIVEIGLLNKEEAAKAVRITLSTDGTERINDVVQLMPNTEYHDVLTIPVRPLFKEDTYSIDVVCAVLDEDGHTVMSRCMTTEIQSKYDLDLAKIAQRTAEFTDPMLPEIKAFIDDRKGPLSKAMGENYCVQGYQSPEHIVPQLDALFRAVHSIGISYVSDTSAMESGFQRVRTPDKVLNDHTGNCIELSILFASLLESMDFEPVVIFPKGHAIVGIVVGTDDYGSSARKPTSGSSGHILRIRTDPTHYFDALFFESTMCPYDWATFQKAVLSAHNTLKKETNWIESNRRYALIEKFRQAGIKPSFR